VAQARYPAQASTFIASITHRHGCLLLLQGRAAEKSRVGCLPAVVERGSPCTIKGAGRAQPYGWSMNKMNNRAESSPPGAREFNGFSTVSLLHCIIPHLQEEPKVIRLCWIFE